MTVSRQPIADVVVDCLAWSRLRLGSDRSREDREALRHEIGIEGEGTSDRKLTHQDERHGVGQRIRFDPTIGGMDPYPCA